MKIIEIYKKYKIMPQLQTHQLRVAAVSSIICDNFQTQTDKRVVISACLLHDMGNIIKFDLEKFPEFNMPEGIQYWSKIQKSFIDKYGTDEHWATLVICAGLVSSKNALTLINSIGFRKAVDNSKSDNYNTQICAYSDMRVMPQKISSLDERLSDLKERYKKRMGPEKYKTFDETANYFYKIENQIFTHCNLKPDDITEEKVKPIVEELKYFDIK